MSDLLPYTIERLSTEADLDAVSALEARSFTKPWTREMLAQELQHSEVARGYVLRLPEVRVAAFCTCWTIADELHINTLAVDPALRRRGLGSVLVRHVIADAQAGGADRATLEVRRSNTPALRLYEQLGFRVEGVRPKYYRDPEEDALILWYRDPGAARASP
jgi:ribosomal-protein-alanine N-acetyltransferase